MSYLVTYTYNETSEESASIGEYAEHGFYQPSGNYYYPVGGTEVEPEDIYDFKDCPDGDIYESLDEAIEEAEKNLHGVVLKESTYEGYYINGGTTQDYPSGRYITIDAHIKKIGD